MADRKIRYIQHDRVEEATAVLHKIRDDPEAVQLELQDIIQAIAFEKQTNSGRYAPLWKDKSIRRRFREYNIVLSYCYGKLL